MALNSDWLLIFLAWISNPDKIHKKKLSEPPCFECSRRKTDKAARSHSDQIVVSSVAVFLDVPQRSQNTAVEETNQIGEFSYYPITRTPGESSSLLSCV